MEALFVVGRILFGGYFLWNGINHFLKLSFMAQYAGAKGVPAPSLAVAGSGLLILVGGALVLLGAWPVVGLASIVVFLLGVTPMMHNFWAVPDPNQRMAEMVNFTKNVSLAGAALMMMFIPQPWPVSLIL